MPLNINFDPKGRWTASVRLPSYLHNMSNLPAWVTDFLELAKHIGKTYLKLIAGDQKIIGQEKAQLIDRLSSFLGGLVMLRRYLTKDEPPVFTSLKSPYRYEFQIKLDSVNWYGSGWFGRNYTFKLTNFRAWYNDVLLKKIRQFFKLYARAMDDNVLTDQERESLIRFIEVLFFDVMVIIKVLKTAGIKS